MPFASLIFIFYFLPVVLVVYYLIPKNLRNLWIVIASLFFYVWGEKKYVLVLLFCIALNYILGIIIENLKQKSRKKLVLILGIVSNLGLLSYFKYFNFALTNFNKLHNFTGLEATIQNIHLPIGISFFVFQAITYIVDIYKGETKALKNPIDLALFKSMFPQLIAGPIVRYNQIEHQIQSRKTTTDDFAYGVKRFITGLAKKVLIANQVALVADQIFAVDAQKLPYNIAWVGILAYTLQIYFDFSGYSDMAIGLARMIGFKFPENFNYPYISSSLQDFWRRWHITLSSWFKDYVYIPLGGSRVGNARSYLNLLIIFLLTGIWHGASWTFVIWGLYNGLVLCIERLFLSKVLKRISIFNRVYTLFVVMIGWVFFRAENITYAGNYLKSMFYLNSSTIASNLQLNNFMDSEKTFYLVLGVVFAFPIFKIIDDKLTNSKVHTKSEIARFLSYSIINKISLAALFLFSVSHLVAQTFNPFIYFRF